MHTIVVTGHHTYQGAARGTPGARNGGVCCVSGNTFWAGAGNLLLHNLVGVASAAHELRHGLHRLADVQEERLVSLAQIVQPRLA